jgi:D-beta-D-heptose 7-phosphate kinase/D-beta-D-heptose 1-phosphate adenosyltransferase
MGKVAIIGDVMLDVYRSGSSSRLSPEAPVPVISNPKESHFLGGAAHVAKVLSGLGIQVDLYCGLGEDSAGNMIREMLKPRINVFTTSIPMTIVKTRIQIQGHQVCRIDEEEYFDCSSQLLKLFSVHVNDYDLVVVSDYGKGAVTSIRGLDHPKIFVDPKGDLLESYAGAFLLKPNTSEFFKLFGVNYLPDHASKVVNALKEANIENILITRGDLPAVLINKDGGILEIPFTVREVNDVTGAGDIVLAGTVAQFHLGLDVKESVASAIQLAAKSVSHHGTGFGAQLISDKVLFQSLQEAIDLKGNLLSEKKKLVITNGCFDLLHPGHLKTLEFAKKQGDFLLVLINSDSSVRQLKGENRPVNNELVRAEMLLSTPNVDGVLVFSGDTPEFEIAALIPDVLIKGGDYDLESVVGYQTVVSNGGRVMLAPFVQGHSTSETIERSQSKNH